MHFFTLDSNSSPLDLLYSDLGTSGYRFQNTHSRELNDCSMDGDEKSCPALPGVNGLVKYFHHYLLDWMVS